MSVAFKSQVGVAYGFTAIIEWYGDTSTGYVQEHFVKAIDFSFKANTVDYSETIWKLSTEFEALLGDFNFTTKGIDFDFEVKDVDYTQVTTKIDKSTKGLT